MVRKMTRHRPVDQDPRFEVSNHSPLEVTVSMMVTMNHPNPGPLV